MKKLRGARRIVTHYYLFFAALAGSAVALGLSLANQQTPANILLAIIAGAELLPLLSGMIRDLRDGKYGVDILAAIAITAALVMGEYWTAVVIVLMLTGGQALEDWAGHRAENELEALLKQAPQKARVLRGRKEIQVKASEVREGDKIVVRAGELVPVDAVILDGIANFDESSLTGESLPQPKTSGQDILSGSVNLDGAITARAQRSAAESQYQQIIKLVKAARGSQAPFVRLADQYAVPFTAISLMIAGVAWAVSGDSLRFLQVLVVATPCPLILAAPIAIISGMSRAAKQGIIVKNGGALERLARARTFAFDKTGTLTIGAPSVDTITTYGSFNEREVLSLAASIDQQSTHALANAIVVHARAQKVKLQVAKQMREHAGKGAQASIRGQTVQVGRLGWLEETGVALPKAVQSKQLQNTAACVAVDGTLVGIITFSDEIRPETKGTLDKLRTLGIQKIMMITGDNPGVAARVAKRLRIDHVISQALPSDKLRALELETKRPVAFVGDGVNDAPVLTASDVGIALGARGAPAASQSADVVIMQDNLARVADGAATAQRSIRIAKQSIWIGIGLSIALMLVYSTGRFSPVSGALVQEVVDIVVIFNALRAHRTVRQVAGRTR